VKNHFVDVIFPRNKKYSYIILDEVSGVIADKLDEGYKKTDIIDYLFSQYDVSKDIIKRDLDKVISSFNMGGILMSSERDNKYNMQKYTIENTYNELNGLYFSENKPFKVFLELTHNCNLRCKHCYLDEHNANMLTLDEAKNIMDQLYESDVVELVLTGGEIGLHPDIIQIIEYATRRFVVTLLTNGTLFDENIIKSICKYPIYEVQISIYGMRELHNRFVGLNTNMWDKSINSIKSFRRYGDVGKAAVVVNAFTLSDIDDLVNYFKINNIEYFLTPIINSSLSGDSRTHLYRITEQQMQALFNNHKLNIGGNICTAGISRFRISPEQNVYPCELLEHICFGNLSEKRFQDVLISNERKEWINYFKLNIGDEECRTCDKRNLCPNCFGMNYQENKDYNIKNSYSCMIANVQYSSLKR
jgi:radical SAM protein with 4Fe4S-binding SPASM domain